MPSANPFLEFKIRVHATCLGMLKERIAVSEQRMMEAKESLQSETKGSAGDKHETSKEMARQELEKIEINHAQLQRSFIQLERLDPRQTQTKVQVGALVQASSKLFYISASVGEVLVEGTKVFCVSNLAPLAKAMLNLEKNSSYSFNDDEGRIDKLA